MLAETILRIIQRHNLFLPYETVLVAVSGGTDSLALLHMLVTLRERLKIHLHVATYDHGLRQGAAEDAQFVYDTARAWNLAVTVGKGDVMAFANMGNLGVEAAARQVRYDFLAATARRITAKRVVTAHHANDQAETVLMHILRGTGMQGLQGMAVLGPMPYHPDMLLVRPLLSTWRQELEAYCQMHHLQPKEDETNADSTFLRNYIRNEMLPYLKKSHPRVETALTRLAEIAQADQNYIQENYLHIAKTHIEYKDNRFYIQREPFRHLHLAMQRRCIFETVQRLSEGADVTYERIIHAVEVGAQGDVGEISQLPGGVQVRVDYDAIVVEKAESPKPRNDAFLKMTAGETITLPIPGDTPVPGQGWGIRTHLGSGMLPSSAQLAIPEGATVQLRTRQAGDRIQMLGLNGGTQKIKTLMINRKIPQYVRDELPLLIVNGEVAALLLRKSWVISESVALTDEKQRVVNFFVYFS